MSVDLDKHQEALDLLSVAFNDPNVSVYIRLDYLCYSVRRIVHRWLGSPVVDHPFFNSVKFNVGNKEKLKKGCDIIAGSIAKDTAIESSPELLSVLRAVIKKFLDGLPSSELKGCQLLVLGAIGQVIDELQPHQAETPNERIIVNRRYQTIRGVLLSLR